MKIFVEFFRRYGDKSVNRVDAYVTKSKCQEWDSEMHLERSRTAGFLPQFSLK